MRKDPVSPELHEYVLRRDGGCFLRRLDSTHICRDRWGQAHPFDALRLLTVEHVHPHPGGTKGKRALNDPRQMVAMCWAGNVGCPSREARQAMREYLRRVEAA